VGNVAITFALATLPIIGTVGFAVDYSHANSVKAAMQAALDSTALMLSREAATDTTSQLQTNALTYFKALFTRPEGTSITISATYSSSDGSNTVVNGSANVPTTFLGVIGYNNIPVNGSSTAKWGSSRLRVALALNNTCKTNNGYYEHAWIANATST
jgi:Flp pilus assembly protein TadG